MADLEAKQCNRCHECAATQQIRSEPVCDDCFKQYATTKAVKRMESYRGRKAKSKQPKKYLLPLSFGPSSTALLFMLDKQIQTKLERMGRVDYELDVIHIRHHLSTSPEEEDLDQVRLDNVKGRFSRHKFEMVGLEDALQLDSIDWKLLGLEPPQIETDLPPTQRLKQMLTSLSSVTSITDVISTIQTRLLVDAAQRHECESILFGDSTTRLAEKTLVQTAKGRGFSLPWQISDGPSPWEVNFYYPLRDLLKKEVITFTSLATPSLDDLIIRDQIGTTISPSAKSTTIDALMAQYFESVEQNYPSIVANVVRTSSKLLPPSDEGSPSCGLCGLPVASGTDGIHGWGGDQRATDHDAVDDGSHVNILCYGCARSLHD